MRPRTDIRIDVAIAGPFRKELSVVWLRKVAAHALREAWPDGEPGQLSLVVTDDDAVRDLNREFRGLDEVTDVLSFSPSHSGHWEGEAQGPRDRALDIDDSTQPAFVLPPGELPVLGEVVISYPQTRRQAPDHNHSVNQELARLVIHGVLHLAGYDHMEPHEADRMRARERAAATAVLQI